MATRTGHPRTPAGGVCVPQISQRDASHPRGEGGTRARRLPPVRLVRQKRGRPARV